MTALLSKSTLNILKIDFITNFLSYNFVCGTNKEFNFKISFHFIVTIISHCCRELWILLDITMEHRQKLSDALRCFVF